MFHLKTVSDKKALSLLINELFHINIFRLIFGQTDYK